MDNLKCSISNAFEAIMLADCYILGLGANNGIISRRNIHADEENKYKL